MWTIIYMSSVDAHLRDDHERLKSLMLTPLITAIAPLPGAMLRDFHGVAIVVCFWKSVAWACNVLSTTL